MVHGTDHEGSALIRSALFGHAFLLPLTWCSMLTGANTTMCWITMSLPGPTTTLGMSEAGQKNKSASYDPVVTGDTIFRNKLEDILYCETWSITKEEVLWLPLSTWSLCTLRRKNLRDLAAAGYQGSQGRRGKSSLGTRIAARARLRRGAGFLPQLRWPLTKRKV